MINGMSKKTGAFRQVPAAKFISSMKARNPNQKVGNTRFIRNVVLEEILFNAFRSAITRLATLRTPSQAVPGHP
jgi:hypothetical protein